MTLDKIDARLIRRAKAITRNRKVSEEFQFGSVGCALLSDKGRVYVGCFIDASSGIGFCAEHAAVAAMLVDGPQRVKRIVAIAEGGVFLPPCGRCRELLYQVNGNRGDAAVLVEAGKRVSLDELLPMPWQGSWERHRRKV